MEKAPDAFRTISEVADDLDIPAHVLRFWETRFVQIKPMKRSGGRRYYRPDDVDLLRGIRRLLYGEGYTIRGVQRILREHGIKAVQGLDDTKIAPASFSGALVDDTNGLDGRLNRNGRNGHSSILLDDDAEADETDFEETGDVLEAVSAEASMNFVPPASYRVGDSHRTPAFLAPEVPVATVPQARPLFSANLGAGVAKSGAEAYAPPSIRKSSQGPDRAKLQAALDDLLGARQLIDRVLKDPDSQT